MPSKTKHKQIKAIFGGTFDPPHLGHLLPLQETADILELPEVSLMPANVPALKQGISEGHHRIEMTRLLCELDPRFKIDLTEFERDSISYTVNTLKYLKEKNANQSIIFIIGLDSLQSLNKWHKWETLFNYCHLVVMLRPPLVTSVTSGVSINHNTDYKALSNPNLGEVALNLYEFYTSEEEFDTIVGKDLDKKTRLLLLSKLAQAENDQHSINHASFKDIISNSTMGNLWFIKNHVLPISSSEIRRKIKTGEALNNLVPQSVLDYIHKHQLYKI